MGADGAMSIAAVYRLGADSHASSSLASPKIRWYEIFKISKLAIMLLSYGINFFLKVLILTANVRYINRTYSSCTIS